MSELDKALEDIDFMRDVIDRARPATTAADEGSVPETHLRTAESPQPGNNWTPGEPPSAVGGQRLPVQPASGPAVHPRGSLRELEQQLYDAHDAISAALEAGDEVPADALATVQSFSLAVQEKREALATVLRLLDGEMEYAEAEAKRWREIQRIREQRIERLKGYILATMQEHQIQRVKGVTTTFSVQQNPPSVEVDDAADLPPELLRHIPEKFEPDRAKIREALKEGREVPGARLVAGSHRLVVR